MKREEFVKVLKSNVKTQRWLSGQFEVEGATVGVKAFGTWVQRLQIEGLSHTFSGSMGHKTQTAMAAEVEEYLARYL